MSEDIRESRDMGFDHRDFFRVLPRALADYSHDIVDRQITVGVGDGTVTITVGPEQVRKIALLEIPWCQVDFHAVGVTESQYADFTTHFHRTFQRGGG